MDTTVLNAQERADKVKLLVVDDNQANLNALEALLDGPDRSVFTALSGQEALRILLREDVAAILLDVKLDVKMDTMDGYETARLIRARDKSREIPIIFLTAHHQDEIDIHKGYALGAVDFLFRPVAPNIVKAKVNCFVALAKQRLLSGLRADQAHSLPPQSRLLIIDDDAALLEALPVSLQLRLPSLHMDLCESPEEALARLTTTPYGAIVCDFKMPAVDGFSILREAQRLQPLTPVLLMTGHGDVTFTSRAIEAGAYDCLHKPFQGEFVALAVKRALESYALRRHRADMHLLLKDLVTYMTELESVTLIAAREIDETPQALEGARLLKLKGLMEQGLLLTQSQIEVIRRMTQTV
jgi:DNA-binding response OmpR family regulator